MNGITDPHMTGVRGARLPAHCEREDLVEPVLDPRLHRDVLDQPRLLTGVAGVLELADRSVELALALAGDVPSVALAVEAPAHGEARVPAPVRALVPGGGAGGR